MTKLRKSFALDICFLHGKSLSLSLRNTFFQCYWSRKHGLLSCDPWKYVFIHTLHVVIDFWVIINLKQKKITTIPILINISQQWNTGRLCQVQLHFPVNLLDVQTFIGLVGIETEGVPSANTRTERMGGTGCRNILKPTCKIRIFCSLTQGWVQCRLIHGDLQTWIYDSMRVSRARQKRHATQPFTTKKWH